MLRDSLPRRSCPAPPRDPGSERNRPLLGVQGRREQRMSPPSRPRPAPSSAGSSQPAPTRSLASQAATPERRALPYWAGCGREGSPRDPPRAEPGRPSLTPSLGRGAPAHNIRPASRLRRPSRVKPRAHRARASARVRLPRKGAPSRSPAGSFPASASTHSTTASHPRLYRSS